MLNYCPTCDRKTEQEPYTTSHVCNGKEETTTYYKCPGCETSRSYLAKDPPEVREFIGRCVTCGRVPFKWKEENWWVQQKDYNHWYECSGCGTAYNLADTPEGREKHFAWQDAGCPPPWWLRPTQLIFCLFVLTMCIWSPLGVLYTYLALCYGITGIVFVTGQIVGGSDTPWYLRLVSFGLWWLLSPVWFPLWVLFMALRPPIL